MRKRWYGGLLSAVTGAAGAQTFPSRPIERAVHGTPGDGPDLIARTVADIVSHNLYEETHLDAKQFHEYLVTRQGEMASFPADVGLAKK